ncbi:MAG: hypothetical protein AAAB35_17260 [Phyllobacterium sp.]|uniref:hypothetical protein n=1 Tax=Phyllobacterium sp. TaxID=1871046 RepID=UPI0030F29B99
MKKLRLLSGAALIATLIVAGASRADTISYADAVSALAKACGTDIKKFCTGLNLGNNQIQNCLEKNGGKVSPTCTSTLTSVTASIKQRQAAQIGFFKLCEHDAAEFCKGVMGEGNILACLLKTKRIDNGKCNQAITDAGWR